MKKLVKLFLFFGLFIAVAGCKNSTDGSAELEKIEITTLPTKLEYYENDSLDLEGLVVTAVYSNGTTVDVTKNIKTSGFDSSVATESQTITVTYKEKTTAFTISITWFHNEVTVLPAETDGTYGTEAIYVEFGDWPQDVVPAADVTTLGLETSTTKVTRGYMEFVKGTDGNYYVKCAENAKIATSTYKDTTTVGQGGTTSRWFKVMPIKWRVYDQEYDVDGDDEGKNATAKLLVAENILTANVPYYDNRVCRTINTKSVYPSNYMHSQIRAYLNGINYQGESAEQTQWNNKGFLQTAFTECTAEKIINTLVDNSEKSTTNYDGYNIKKATDLYCENTQDKIFLLSELEVTKYSKSGEKYNAAASSRVRKVTDFALANYAFQSATVTDSCYWWLRSPKYSDSNYSRYIDENGKAEGASYIDKNWNGVVPALCIQY